jgi:hypothetical protein
MQVGAAHRARISFLVKARAASGAAPVEPPACSLGLQIGACEQPGVLSVCTWDARAGAHGLIAERAALGGARNGGSTVRAAFFSAVFAHRDAGARQLALGSRELGAAHDAGARRDADLGPAVRAGSFAARSGPRPRQCGADLFYPGRSSH